MAKKIEVEVIEVPAIERATYERQGWKITGMSKFREVVVYRMRREVRK